MQTRISFRRQRIPVIFVANSMFPCEFSSRISLAQWLFTSLSLLYMKLSFFLSLEVLLSLSLPIYLFRRIFHTALLSNNSLNLNEIIATVVTLMLWIFESTRMLHIVHARYQISCKLIKHAKGKLSQIISPKGSFSFHSFHFSFLSFACFRFTSI